KKPRASLLLRALRHDADLRMPPKYKLPAVVIADFETWVAQGAPDPRDGKTVARPRTEHWAFQPLRTGTIPAVADPWVRTPIDAFILGELKARGLTPSPRAEVRVLVRRLAFDLLGLPPSPADIDATLADPSDAGIDQLVERWLASPHHGE